MLNRLTRARSVSARQTLFLHGIANIFLRTAYRFLMFFGVTAIVVLCTILLKPDFFHLLRSQLPLDREIATTSGLKESDSGKTSELQKNMFVQSSSDLPQTAKPLQTGGGNKKPTEIQKQQQWVTYWIAKRYRVAEDAANMLVATTYSTGKEIKLDPLLILAVIAIESRFNPFAESAMGAQGLMQVMSKIHHQKFAELGGLKAALNPVANIRVGSLILKDYVTRSGSVEGGLKYYVGAADNQNDAGYGARVLAEYRRLKEVASGKNVPIFAATSIASQKQPVTSQAKTNLSADSGPVVLEPAVLAAEKDEQVAAL